MHPPESVAGIIFSPERKSVLLIQRRDVPVWVLPGGGIEPNESPEEAIVREICEETGFQVKITRLSAIYTPINRLARHTHLYECEILNGEAKTSSETRDVKFYSLDCLPKLIPPPYTEWILDGFETGPTIQKSLTSVNYLTLFKHLILHPTLVIRFLLARAGLYRT